MTHIQAVGIIGSSRGILAMKMIGEAAGELTGCES
jgi:hypothetical protein